MRGAFVAGAVVVLGAAAVAASLTSGSSSRPQRGPRPAAVEVAPVARGRVALRRSYGGSLEAPARLVVAPRVLGQLVDLTVDLGDPVQRGQVVARLEDAELRQQAAAARAELRVAAARAQAAASTARLARRELERLEALQGRGVTSPAQIDQARAEAESQSAAEDVAKAEVTRARAALEAARVRLGYATLTADWSGGADVRFVAARLAEPGALVEANAPLLEVVGLDPLRAVVLAPEKDDALLEAGLAAELMVDAYPPAAAFRPRSRGSRPATSPGPGRPGSSSSCRTRRVRSRRACSPGSR